MKFKLKHIWLYLLFFSTITVLVFVNVRIVDNAIDESMTFAKVMNFAGRQRMLSQKMVKDALLSYLNEQKSTSFDSNLRQWNEVHQALQNGGGEYDLPLKRFEKVDSVFAKLNPVQRALSDNLMLVSKSVPDKALLNEILSNENDFLPLMDEAVSAYQSQAELEFTLIREKQKWLAIISGLILVLEMIFFVLPNHRKLLLAYKQLKIQKAEIEDQKEEINQQMETLSEQHEEINAQVHALGEQQVQLERLNSSKELTLLGINAGVWDWDIKTGKEEWSPNFFRLLGYEVNATPATYDNFMNHLLHADDRQMVMDAVEKHLKEHVPYKLNIRLHNHDGNYRWYEASGRAKWDENGEPVQMAGSIIDIEERMQYRNELETLNYTKDKIFSIVAHDLRNPIGNLKILIELQEDNMIGKEEFLEYVEKVKENVIFLSETLDNLLKWAQSQMKGFHTKYIYLDLAEIADTVKKLHDSAARQKHITLENHIKEQYLVYADKDHVFLIIRNIVSNAVKFTPVGGHIDIAARDNGAYTDVVISDTGVGMTEADIDKLLDRNTLFSKPGTNGEKGTGLGLTLCREVIAENKGKFNIESEPGKGSHFIVSFPKMA